MVFIKKKDARIMPVSSSQRSTAETVPAYIGLFGDGELTRRMRLAREMLTCCHLCPRKCGVDRYQGETGDCGAPRPARMASAGPHYGEERPLVGWGGSGTVFFSYCNLHCVFCQNSDISQGGYGRDVSADELSRCMLELQARGCHNVNLVTPTPYVPQILEALLPAVEKGLTIPIVYNCGGYESMETLQLLDGLVDIYMPDFKYGSNESAVLYSGAADYWERCCEAVAEMHRQVGVLKTDERGLAWRGVLIRHLVLPDGLAESERVLSFIAESLSPDSFVNIMDQYYPSYLAGRWPSLSRRITSREYQTVVEMAVGAGLHRGFQSNAAM